ncbi:hypothetical protein F4802DRAFT_607044 [Xylaria palmicola]|nr:hypothetical protein F4802DRAFT_607044 [Xylaria palmicola]
MAAAGIDVGYLATHLGMPETNISLAISDPTADLVNAVLAAVATKAHDLDALYSQKLQLEVELETTVRTAEAQRDASNETAKKALKDVEEIRQKLTQEETKRQTLENELQSLKSSSSTSQSDIDALRSRITSLETSNRESLAIIDTKNATNETLSQELQAQHQKNLKLSQEVTALQQAVQNATAVSSSAKIREQGLQRQLEASKRDNEWMDQELKKKTAEALSYRKEKGARIAELQRQNDDATSVVESLKRGEQQLRQRLQDAQRKADDALAKVQQLEEAAARREEDFQQQIDRLQRLHELVEQQNTTQKTRLQAMEEREAHVKKECEEKVQQVSKEIASLNMDKEELAQANESLQAEVGRLEAMIASGAGGSSGQPGSAPQTPRPLNGSMYRPSSPFTTPGSMRKSVSATQALDEYYKDLEDLEELYAENERLQSEIKNMSHLSDESFQSTATQAQAENTILRNQIRDLGAQIQMLLFNMHCQEKGLDELTIEETLHFQKLERGQRLVKNEKLLQSDAAIAAKNQAVEDHNERIRLQQELDIKTESITKERDMFPSALGHPPQDGVLASIEQNSVVGADEFDDYRKEQTTDRKTLKEQIEKLSAERSKLQSEVSRITSQLSLASERFDMLKRNQTMSEAMAEKNLWQDIQDRLSRDNENLVQEKSRLNETKQADLTSTKRKLAEEFDAQQSQKRIDELTANLGQLREELAAVKTSRDHLQSRERTERLQPRPTPRPGSMSDKMTKSQLENAEGQELERLNSAHDQYAQDMDNTLATKDATIKELSQRIEDLSSELSRSNNELSVLRDSQADVTRRFEEEKKERYAEIATTAQQSYENEVMKHGETAKALSNVRNEYNQLKTTATLMQSESSWDERRQRLEQEISEIRARWEDANAQNKILHQQLENSRPGGSDVDKYRELSNYLRREKDILEVQFELKLDEARLKLEQEQELNLFRESTQAQLSEKIAKITELESTIQPLEAQIEELENRDRWQKRTEDILSKHGRTDPAEVEELRQRAETPLREKVQQLENSIAVKEADWARSRILTTAKNQILAEKEQVQKSFEEELETFKKAKSELEEQVLEFRRQVSSLQTPLESPDSQAALAELQDQLTATQSELETELQQQTGTEAHTQTNGDSTMEDSRKKLEEQIAASEARAADDKMKEALNKRLTQLQQDKERLEADFKLRMEQERKIWETEQATAQTEMKVPATPQQPKPEAPVATPSTPISDLNSLGDQDIRELVSKNATVRSIVQNNIKSKLAAEAKKMKEEHEASTKAEWEQKLAQAKESATQLVTSKMNLKLNMTENRARMANAKLEVVQTAARDTPQRPVGEVWEIAKIAKPPPIPKPSATPAAPATPSGPPRSTTATANNKYTAPATQPTPSTPTPVSGGTKPALPASVPPKPTVPNAPQPNPFISGQQNQANQAAPTATAPNPFSQTGLPALQPTGPTGIPQPVQSSAPQIPKASGLPIPGGARKPSGPQLPRGGARGGGHQRGRGGAHQGRPSLNPSADNFLPGAKRPRGDSEAGNGPKRARGGGGPGS